MKLTLLLPLAFLAGCSTITEKQELERTAMVEMHLAELDVQAKQERLDTLKVKTVEATKQHAEAVKLHEGTVTKFLEVIK